MINLEYTFLALGGYIPNNVICVIIVLTLWNILKLEPEVMVTKWKEDTKGIMVYI